MVVVCVCKCVCVVVGGGCLNAFVVVSQDPTGQGQDRRRVEGLTFNKTLTYVILFMLPGEQHVSKSWTLHV